MYEEMNGQEPYSQQNTGGQPEYNYGTDSRQERPEGGVGFGIASLVLGIIALVTFCTFCLNVPLAILAIIFGIVQLVRGNGKGMAIGGLITAGCSLIAMIIFWIVMGFSMSNLSNLSNFDSYMQQYEDQLYNNNYDYGDDYSDDYDQNDNTF